MKIKNRFTFYNDKISDVHSTYSITVPNQAPSLKYIIMQVQQGNSVNVLQMRYDKDADIDDIDLRYLDARHITSDEIDFILSDMEKQKLARGEKLVNEDNKVNEDNLIEIEDN